MIVERIVSWAHVRPPLTGPADSPMDSAQTVSYPRVYAGTWVSQKWLSEHRWTRVRSPAWHEHQRRGSTARDTEINHLSCSRGLSRTPRADIRQGCRLQFCSPYLNALKIIRRSHPRNRRLHLWPTTRSSAIIQLYSENRNRAW